MAEEYIYKINTGYEGIKTKLVGRKSFKKEFPSNLVISKNLIPAIANILYKFIDHCYSEPFIILLGVSFDLVCCRLSQGSMELLWSSGTIGNNFYGSSFKNAVNVDYRFFKMIKKLGAANVHAFEKDSKQPFEKKHEETAGIPDDQIDRTLNQDLMMQNRFITGHRRYLNPEVGTVMKFVSVKN